MSLKLLICCPISLDENLGAARVSIQVAQAMSAFGWEVTLLDDSAVTDRLRDLHLTTDGPYQERLRRFLQRVSGDYDVIEYEHWCLPFPRGEFSASTLMVARSVLLHLYEGIQFPGFRRLRDRVRRWLRGGRKAVWNATFRDLAEKTLWQADLINVANRRDAELLRNLGYPDRKIIVQPYAISAESTAAFQAIDLDRRRDPSVVFLGSFDPRKGGPDLPVIFANIAAQIPSVNFHLLGTSGMFHSAGEVLSVFPQRLRQRLRVVPRFTSSQLPALLGSLSLGVFPSYLEGFGFAVLEQLASGLPVVAYDSPGPSDILPTEWLVSPGDAQALAERAIALLSDERLLQTARHLARAHASKFDWSLIGASTSACYQASLTAVRDAHSAH
jgi:glycosyltransferase involved in cell wall biosynthesis